MAIRDIEKTFVFPRIPLNFELPENYPEVGKILNISIVPEITHFRFGRDELEIKGEYQIAVSYIKGQSDSGTDKLENREFCDNFFSILKIQSNGLFTDDEPESSLINSKTSPELYTVHFNRSFHTYLDLEVIPRPRFFRPGMVVERAHLERNGGRTLKGELVLGLVNVARRGFR